MKFLRQSPNKGMERVITYVFPLKNKNLTLDTLGIEKGTRYCWRTYFHALAAAFLNRMFQDSLGSKRPYLEFNSRLFGVRQQYREPFSIGFVYTQKSLCFNIQNG